MGLNSFNSGVVYPWLYYCGPASNKRFPSMMSRDDSSSRQSTNQFWHRVSPWSKFRWKVSGILWNLPWSSIQASLRLHLLGGQVLHAIGVPWWFVFLPAVIHQQINLTPDVSNQNHEGKVSEFVSVMTLIVPWSLSLIRSQSVLCTQISWVDRQLLQIRTG